MKLVKDILLNFVAPLLQVLVYHDLLGMMQHPHHAKVVDDDDDDLYRIVLEFTVYKYLLLCCRLRLSSVNSMQMLEKLSTKLCWSTRKK